MKAMPPRVGFSEMLDRLRAARSNLRVLGPPLPADLTNASVFITRSSITHGIARLQKRLHGRRNRGLLSGRYLRATIGTRLDEMSHVPVAVAA